LWLSIMGGFLNKIVNSKSRMFLMFCFCFILGAASFSWVMERGSLLFYLFLILFLPFLLLILFWKYNFYRFLSLCLLFFLLGAMRFIAAIPPDNPGQLHHYNGYGVRVTGYVSDEPDVRIKDSRYYIRAEQISVEELSWKNVEGKLLLKTLLYPQYEYGERMALACKLEAPEKDEESRFDYPRYLARYGVWSICERVQVLSSRPFVIPSGAAAESRDPLTNAAKGQGISPLRPPTSAFGRNDKGSKIFFPILQLKSKISNQLNRLWSEPESSFMAGLLYGARSGLPEELLDNFNRTGVTHVIAVSGFNVSIIASVLMTILIGAGLYRRQAFWAAVAGIVLFVLFTGASASVVRAGIMASIVLIAQYIGRLSSAGRLMVYAAVIMLLINPWVLIWDAGFQLSFLATLGLVYLAPLIRRDGSPKATVSTVGLYEILISTLAAIIATLPLILYQFGRLSLVAPIVNVLILWIIPWLMLFGFLSVMVSFAFFPLGQVLAWVAGAGLKYVIIVVEWFGRRSWSGIDFSIPWWVMAGMYVAMVFFVIPSGAVAESRDPLNYGKRDSPPSAS